MANGTSPIVKRLLVLQGVLLLGLGSIALLPKAPERPEPGISMNLPLFVGDWVGKDEEVSEKERQVLGPDTQFARKSYTNMKGDQIFVSIVLAGHDMNTSIHRPERCLPAQGYVMIDSSVRKLDMDNPITVTRLHNKRNIPLRDGGHITEYSLDYYWFVGSSETTHDHIERNYIDVRDRLLKGYNQPWAFVTVICRITEGLLPRGRSEAETDKVINDFLKELIPVIMKDTVKRK